MQIPIPRINLWWDYTRINDFIAKIVTKFLLNLHNLLNEKFSGNIPSFVYVFKISITLAMDFMYHWCYENFINQPNLYQEALGTTFITIQYNYIKYKKGNIKQNKNIKEKLPIEMLLQFINS